MLISHSHPVVASASRTSFAGPASTDDLAQHVVRSLAGGSALSFGLERIANTPVRLPREIFSKIASYLISYPKDIIAFSVLDRDCADNLRGERVFSKVILRIDTIDTADFTLALFGELLKPILHDIPQTRLAGDALLHLVTRMRFPAVHGGGKSFNQILDSKHIALAKKAEILSVLAQKNNILNVDKAAFQRIMDAVAEMPATLRSVETTEQAKACNSELKYHKGALTGLVALSVTQPTEANRHATMVAIVAALKDIPIEHRAAPLYQFAWFMGYFKDRQGVFDRLVEATKTLLPKDQRADVLLRLDSETWRLPKARRERARSIVANLR